MGATHLMMLSRNLGHQHAVNTKMMTSSILIICFLLLLILFVLFTVLVLCCTMKILWFVVLFLLPCSFIPWVNDADGVSLSKHNNHVIRTTQIFFLQVATNLIFLCFAGRGTKGRSDSEGSELVHRASSYPLRWQDLVLLCLLHTEGPGVRKDGHVLGGPPEGLDDFVVGGGHENNGEEEDDHHLVKSNKNSPHWRCLHSPI